MAEFTTRQVSYLEDRADGGFAWNVRYDLSFQGGTFHTDLRVRLSADPGAEIRQAWESGVDRIWNEQVFFSDGTRLYPVELDFDFVSSGEHQVVNVHFGAGRFNMANWYTFPSGWGNSFHDEIAAHEAGHMWGNFDEYAGGATSQGQIFSGRLMADNTPVVLPYYFFSVEFFAEQHSGLTLTAVSAFRGSSSGSVITGTSGMDGIYARGGNDDVLGKGGNDYLDGGSGDDFIEGGDGNDILIGGAGNDVFDWSSGTRAGTDVMNGGAGNDVYVIDETNTDLVIDSSGRDRIWSPFSYSLESRTDIEELGLYGSESLTATGNTGNNRLLGNSGSNLLSGLEGNDHISGGAGGDTLHGGTGNDRLNGESGSDTASYADATAGVIVKLSVTKAQNTVGDGTDTLVSIERVTGSGHDDQIHGSSGGNVLDGGAGNDLLRGLGGNDTLVGGDGTDTASYTGAASKVIVRLSLATAQKTGGAGTDTLSEIENLTGSSYDDRLFGSDAANVLAGGSGNDQLRGGLGNDTLTGGGGKDQFFIDSALGAGNVDTITDFKHASDRIYLDDDIFGALAVAKTTRLKAANLSITGAAADADDFIVYDPTSGALYYDADGSGAGAAVQFAVLGTSTHPAISAADIYITT